MKTLKYLVTASAAAVAAMFGASAANAAQDVASTVHNLSLNTNPVYQTNTDEICVFCHTPHFASATAKPLWNRTTSTASYTMYDNTWSSTIDMTVAGTPQGVSAACLSCHDGTVALDALLNQPGPGGVVGEGVSAGYTWTGVTGNTLDIADVLIGTDLTNDHPISITYNTTDDPQFNAVVSGKVGALPLYSGNVECGTCHDPHEATTQPFLRMSNAASALCLTCHIK